MPTSALRRQIGALASVLLAGIVIACGLYQFNEWWPGCNFVTARTQGEPLMISAAAQGCTGCIRTMVRGGADPNVRDGYVTPLIAAVQSSNYATARFLLTHGAQVNAGTGAGTALCQALMTENPDGGMTKLLLSSGASLRWPGDHNQAEFSVFDCLHHSDVGPTPEEEARRFGDLIDYGVVDVFSSLPQERQRQLSLFLYEDEIKQLAEHGAKFSGR